MKWFGMGDGDGTDSGSAVMTCDDTPDTDVIGHLMLETWRDAQAEWRAAHGIEDV